MKREEQLTIFFICLSQTFEEHQDSHSIVNKDQFDNSIYSTYNKTGYRNFANRTLASRTFATGENPGVYWRNSTALSPIGEIPKDALAKVRWTFASCDESILTQNTYESNSQSNWQNSSRDVGESTVDFRQLAKFPRVYFMFG